MLENKDSGCYICGLMFQVKRGQTHREEIENFTKIAKADDVKFHDLTYQELIIKMSADFRHDHDRYIRYLTEHYL